MNRQIADATSERLGIQAFFFLQPIPIAGKNLEVYRDAYVALREETATGTVPNFFDISRPLEQELQYPYVDVVHYSEKGCLMVARRMAEKVLTHIDIVEP